MAGPKLLGWHDRTHLLEIGISIAANGNRWTGLEPAEYDQGQRDGVHEVLAVSTAGALIRRDVFEQLGGFLTQQMGEEQFILYAPKREVKIRPGTSPFSTELIAISGRFDYNKEVNSQIVLVPLDFARSILRYEKELTGYAIYLNSGQSLSETKELLQKAYFMSVRF